MTDMLNKSIEEMIQCVTNSQGSEKIQSLFPLLLYALTFFIRNENITSEKCKTKNHLK